MWLLCCCEPCTCDWWPETFDWGECTPIESNYNQFAPGSAPMDWDPAFLTLSGFLICADSSFPSVNDDVICTRTYSKPTGSGHVIEFGATCRANNAGTGTVGIYLGDDTDIANARVQYFLACFQTPNNNTLRVRYNLGTPADVKTGIDSGVSQPIAHDLKVVMTEVGTNSYDIDLYMDGTLEQTDTSVSITLPSSFECGFFCTDRGDWNCHYVKLTDGT